MKASVYVKIKNKAHGLREVFVGGKRYQVLSELKLLDRRVDKALEFERFESAMGVVTLIGIVGLFFLFFLALAISELSRTSPYRQELDVILTWAGAVLAGVTVTAFISMIGAWLAQSRLMTCSPETEKFAGLVTVVLEQEKQKERANLILNTNDPRCANGLCESLVALLAGDLVDAEDSRETDENVEKARSRFHRTYEALTELGVPLEKKRTYFPVKAK